MANFGGGGFASSSSSSHHLPPSPSDRSPSLLKQAQRPSNPTQQVPESQQQAQLQAGHKRVYQACIPCRRRKVRCILGPVDNPHDPPCDRCRRESKECYFSATRRKRKADEDDTADPEVDDYVVRNGRRKLQSEDSSVNGSLDRSHFSDTPLAPANIISAAAAATGSVRSHPLRRPKSGDLHDRSRASSAAPRRADGRLGAADESNTPLENLEAQSVMRREVYGPHDALDLLYKAATDGPHTKHDELSNGASASDPLQNRFVASRDQSTLNTDRLSTATNNAYHAAQQPLLSGTAAAQQPVDPNRTRPDPSTLPGYAEAVKLWTRFRFVRAGWFTAQEAIDYIDYYYKFLSPLTPISPPTFDNPASHQTLLTEEPILAVTLLTIASRYKSLPGTGGICRAHAIHEQLWTYLRGMIERVVWGQEAFGGGFCGSGADESQTSSTAPWRGLRRGSLRTLGTIESFMILTEWHPRALHFPPAEVTDELLLPSPDRDPPPANEDDVPRPLGVGGKRIDGWLEPAWRSDRMCWMLLSTAMGLAYELGVFDDVDELLASDAITRPEYEDETHRLRASRIKRLLLIYLSQLAGRLGWTNMVSDQLRRKDAATARKRPNSFADAQTPATNHSTSSTTFNYIPDLELDDQIIHCWAGISNAMNAGNERIFRSRQYTTDIIQSGKYIEILRDFQPLLRDWYKEFERFKLPVFTRHILTIEYEYVRIYINSLSLQAVVERCTSNAGNTASAGSNSSGNAVPQLSPQTQNYYGKLPLGQLGGFGAADRECVKEVVDGCRNLLRTVVDGLLPGGYLKHAPVRTYFRIISGALFLLKTFALGASKADIETSIALMDRTVDALRNCIVDDVHLGIRFADLLESLTGRLRNRFIYAPPSATASNTGNGAPTTLPSGDGRRSPLMHAESSGTSLINGQPSLSASRHGLGLHEHGHAAVSAAAATVFGTGEPNWGKMGGFSGMEEHASTPTANVSATAFDPAAGSFPYTPGLPPTLNPSTPMATGVGSVDNSATALGSGSGMFGPDDMDWNDREMWYLPTGPAFFQNVGDASNTVAMTAEGVNVAGLDLLDFMTMDSTGY